MSQDIFTLRNSGIVRSLNTSFCCTSLTWWAVIRKHPTTPSSVAPSWTTSTCAPKPSNATLAAFGTRKRTKHLVRREAYLEKSSWTHPPGLCVITPSVRLCTCMPYSVHTKRTGRPAAQIAPICSAVSWLRVKKASDFRFPCSPLSS